MAKTILSLFRNKIFNLRSVFLGTGNVRNSSRLAEEASKSRYYFAIKHYTYAEALLKEYQNQKNSSLSWSNIINDLSEVEEEAKVKLDSVILNSCLNLNLTDVAASYFEFLLNSGKEPKLIDTYLFLSLFAQNPSQIAKNETTLLRAFDIVTKHLPLQPKLLTIAAEVYCMIPTTWKVILDITDKSFVSSMEKKSALIAGGFNNDEADGSWALLKSHPQDLNNVVTEAYLNYCIRKAKKNEFSISLLNDLVNFCMSKAVVLKHENLLGKFRELTQILNSGSTSEIQWTVHTSFVNKRGICSNCNKKLKEVVISREEIDCLKKEFLNDVIIGKDINIKTTPEELRKFKHYLKTCGPYDVVIDGLNMSKLTKRNIELNQVVDYFFKRNLQILIIGKKYLMFRKDFKEIKDECKYFLMDKLSDDDVFIIYAALSMGPSCYFLTKDYFRGYVDQLKNSETKRTFMKWMVSHQYGCHHTHLKINSPQKHAGLSQLTVHENGDRVLGYHFSENFQALPRVNIPVNWVCFQGRPKGEVGRKKGIKKTEY